MSDLSRVRQYLALSLAGGVLVLVIALFGYDEDVVVGETDRRFLGLTLLLVAAMGIVSAFRPNWRRRVFHDDEVEEGLGTTDGRSTLSGPPRRGHHPDCEGFASHTITFRGKVRCAGCTGLAIGAFGVALVVWAYVASRTSLEWWEGIALVLTGLSLVALDLGVSLTGSIDPRAGLGLNALMVLGFALMAIGLLEATGQLAWGLVGVVLAILWMDTRIQLSRWNHAAVCAVCPERCVAYTL